MCGALEPAKHGGPFPGVLRFPTRASDKHHMVGKPTELMRALVRCVPPGGVVVDPFAGSGTTAVACYLEGRRCVSFELDPSNVTIARKRLEAAHAGVDYVSADRGQTALFVDVEA